MQAKLRRSERFKSDLLDLIQEQEMWKRDQERIHAEENEKIVEYIEQRDRHAEVQRQAEQHKLHAMLEQQERMANALNDIEVNRHMTIAPNPNRITTVHLCSKQNWSMRTYSWN